MKTTFTLIFILSAFILNAQVAGPFGGSSFYNESCGGQQSWNQVSNSNESDDIYATTGNIPGNAGSFSEYLVATGFNFDLPDGVTVYGVKVDVERSDPNQASIENSVRLVIGGLVLGDDRSNGAPFPSTDQITSYGGATDVWGTSLSYKDVDNSNFGVAISVKRKDDNSITDARIDNIQITVYYAFVTLPVQLHSFTATASGSGVKVVWKTATESAIDKYFVERSFNGTDYVSIHTEPAKNVDGSSYTVADLRPFPGTSYYRLRIKENNGSIKFSPVATLYLESPKEYRVSPSPWTEGQALFIANPAKEKLTIRFYDGNGKLISETITDSRQIEPNKLGSYKGIAYYTVLNAQGKPAGSGNILVY